MFIHVINWLQCCGTLFGRAVQFPDGFGRPFKELLAVDNLRVIVCVCVQSLVFVVILKNILVWQSYVVQFTIFTLLQDVIIWIFVKFKP